MQIINITNKEQLNNFAGAQKHSQFLQSWEWGELQEAVGNKIFRMGVESEGELIAIATLIKKKLPMGKFYFYCPRGSDVGCRMSDVGNFLFKKIEKVANDERVIFLRFDPISNIQYPISNIQKTIDVQPSKTLILNLKKDEQDLLKAMHQKTRYNIRLAERKGVKIVGTQDFASGFENFWRLMNETVKRDGFRLHSKEYYKKMLLVGNPVATGTTLIIKLFLAEYKDKVIAANIVSFFGDTATYMHGASSNEYRNVMAPYLLQWHCIKLARELGYKYYDFYGIDEKKWPGVTRFKMGFGGRAVNYPGTFDFIFNKMWYSVYRMARKVRRTF